MEKTLKATGIIARAVAIDMAAIATGVGVQGQKTICCSPPGRRHGPRRLWMMMAGFFVGHLTGCGSESAVTKPASGEVGRKTESPNVRILGQGGAATAGTDQISAPNPSAQEPVTATMVIRPESLSAGEAAEMLVYVRIATAHYVHAAKKPGEPWIPLAMTVSLPDGVEFSGDWQLPAPETRRGDALVYYDSALLRRALRIRPQSSPRTLRVSGKLRYQACTDEFCWPVRTIDLSAPLTIREGEITQ